MRMSPNESGIDAVRGASRLVIDGVEQVTHIVEGVHAAIASVPGRAADAVPERAAGVAGLVYDVVRRVAGGVRFVLDGGFALAAQRVAPPLPQPHWDLVRSALNGVVGDHLERTGNPLAIPMRLRRDGASLVIDRDALRGAIPGASGRILVLVHGLCMNDRQWTRNGRHHGAALERDARWTSLALHYNTGRHVYENGRDLAFLLEQLLREWPVAVEEIALVGHSMGGLVARSAVAAGTLAALDWPKKLARLVFLATPHHGAPLERAGNSLQTFVGVSPYTKPLARLGMLRSAGITDLRYGNVVAEDWGGRDRFEACADPRTPLPLPDGVTCYAVATTLGLAAGDVRDRLFGDGLVPLASALGRHALAERTLRFEEANQWIGYGLNHWDVLDHPDVYARLRFWLG